MIQIVAVPEASHWLVSQVGHNAQAPSDMPSPPDPDDHSRAAQILGRMTNSNHEASPAPGGNAKQHLMQVVRESFVGASWRHVLSAHTTSRPGGVPILPGGLEKHHEKVQWGNLVSFVITMPSTWAPADNVKTAAHGPWMPTWQEAREAACFDAVCSLLACAPINSEWCSHFGGMATNPSKIFCKQHGPHTVRCMVPKGQPLARLARAGPGHRMTPYQ